MGNKEITRERIISTLAEGLKDNSKVYAFWLEGSDGTNTVDEYSDIDIVVDVEDGNEDETFNIVQELLSSLGKLDFNFKCDHPHPKLRQKYYHLQNSSEYLIIDFCIQLHSPDREESTYVRGDKVEVPKVIFDKCNIIRFKDADEEKIKANILERLKELKGRYKQHSRVVKYIKRQQFLEAYAYYHKYVVEPILELKRMKYTPSYYYLYLIHISNHLPESEILELEKFYKVTTVEEIEERVIEAKELFNKLIEEVEGIYR